MTKEARLHSTLSQDDKANFLYKGHYKIGKEYAINGVNYKPKEDLSYDKIGIASWYGGKDNFHGKTTANGDKYNHHTLTAAHLTLPMPSLVKITNLSNNKSLIVMVNDRGPFIKGRIIDVSETAAKLLAFKHKGHCKVRVEYLHKETTEFLDNIGLQNKPGSRAKSFSAKRQKPYCSVNCHVKLVNIKNGLLSKP